MNPTRILTAAFTAPVLLLASCGVHSDEYNTPPPYTPPTEPANPIYDSPAAYEQDIPGNPATMDPGLPVDPGTSTYTDPAAPGIATAPSRANAVVHTVERGDTLSGLSSKYNVPMESIRRANNMTSDIVVLGRKMIIPPQ